MTDGWVPGFERVAVSKPGGPYLAGVSPKVTGHTTEGFSRDPRGAFSRHPFPPQCWVTPPSHPYAPRLRLQGIPATRSGYALKHPAGTPETNKAGCFQVEIEWFAGRIHQLTDDDWRWLADEVFEPMCATVGADPSNWLACYGLELPGIATTASPIRLPGGWAGGAGFYAYNGVHWHQHTPDNTHWDGGAAPDHCAGHLGGARQEDHMSAEDVDRLEETLGRWMQEQSANVVAAIKAPIAELLEQAKLNQKETWLAERLIVGALVAPAKAGLIKPRDIPHEVRLKARALHERHPAEGYDALLLGEGD